MAEGYVVVEFNQAGGFPDLPFGATLHLYEDDARAERDELQRRTDLTGRLDRYRLAEVNVIDREDI